MGSTNWLHPFWNPTGSVNVSEGASPPPIAGVQIPAQFRQAQPAAPTFLGQNMPTSQLFSGQMHKSVTGNPFVFGGPVVGGGGGGGGGYKFDKDEAERRRNIKISARPEDYIPTGTNPAADYIPTGKSKASEYFGRVNPAGLGMLPDRGDFGQVPPQGYKDGGEPPVGTPALVGEEGPELIVPKQPIQVVPLPADLKRPEGSSNGLLELPESSTGGKGYGWSTGADVYAGGAQAPVMPVVTANQTQRVPPAPVVAPAQPPPAPVAAQAAQAAPPAGLFLPAVDVPKDPLEKFMDDPVIAAHVNRAQRQFMRSPQGGLYKLKTEMDNAAAAAQVAHENAKFNAQQQDKLLGHDITRQNAIDREAGLSDRLLTTQALIEDRFKRSQEGTDKRQANTFEQANNVRKAKEAKDKELSDKIDKGHEEYMAHQIASGTIKAEDAAAIMKLPHAFRQAELVRREKEAADKAKKEGAKLDPNHIASELAAARKDALKYNEFILDKTTGQEVPNPNADPVLKSSAWKRVHALQKMMDQHLGIQGESSSGTTTEPKKAGLNDMINGAVSP